MLLFEGVAYSGQIHVLDIPGCEDYLSIVVHFQLANNSGIDTQGLPVWTSQGPHNWDLGSNIPDASVNVGCVSQSSYINDMGTFEVMKIPPGASSDIESPPRNPVSVMLNTLMQVNNRWSTKTAHSMQ